MEGVKYPFSPFSVVSLQYFGGFMDTGEIVFLFGSIDLEWHEQSFKEYRCFYPQRRNSISATKSISSELMTTNVKATHTSDRRNQGSVMDGRLTRIRKIWRIISESANF